MTDTTAIRQLHKIFKDKDWNHKDSENIIFEQFCDLLEILEPDERSLLLELTERYFWITSDEYEKYIKEAINLIPLEDLKAVKKMYIFPIVKPGDDGKAKSGIGLVYDIKSMMPRIPRFIDIQPKPLEKFADFNLITELKANEVLCLVDDYIGTGDTLFQCLDEISKMMTYNNEKIMIVSISCQKETFKTIVDKGIRIFAKYLLPKGITDFNELPMVEQKKNLMKIIERNIPGSQSFSLGFQESEATITLKRTPDNTFPVFWKRFRKRGKYYNAPFLRID